MKTSKRYIAILLLLCTLLSTISFASDVLLDDVNKDERFAFDSLEIKSNDAELMPMAANSCGGVNSWYDIDHNTKSQILRDAAGFPVWLVGKNPDIGFNVLGLIVLIGTGNFKGNTFVTDLLREWYL